MSDNLLDKVSSFSERLKIGGAEVSRKMTEGMSSMSEKVKELFQGPNQTDKLVEEATAETLDEPDWATNLELCDMINLEKIPSVELIRGIKKRIMLKSPRVQFLALVLLETVVKNCDKAFSEVAAERVLDEMVKLIDDPQTVINSRNKALILIEAWGESSDELRYLPVFEETYKSLKSRGIRFPGRDNESLAPIFTPTPSITSSETNDNLAQHIPRDILPVVTFSAEQTREELEVARNSAELLSTVLSSSPGEDASEDEATVALVQQCHQSQFTVQRMIETAGENEALMFEALNVNDELLKVLSKYEDLKKPEIVREGLEPAMIPVAVEPDESLQWKEDDTTTLVRKPSGSRAGVNNNNNDDMMDDLDEMIFGKKKVAAAAAAAGSNSEGTGDAKKNQQASKDGLISF